MPPFCTKHNCYHQPIDGRMRCPQCHADEEARAHYDHLLARVLRMGQWLAGPQALRLAPDDWERQFGLYRENLEELRRLGGFLSPTVELSVETSELLGEVQELFAV